MSATDLVIAKAIDIAPFTKRIGTNRRAFAFPATSAMLYSVALLASLIIAAPANAAVVLLNGSFEQVTGSAVNGVYEAANWVDASSAWFEATSAPSGLEQTNPTDGSRYLRIATDVGYTALIFQNIGTMAAGQTYVLTGDVLGSSNNVGNTWGAKIDFASNGAASPTAVYATEQATGVAIGAAAVGAINISFTATSADNGLPLYVVIAGDNVASGDTRGGIDNLVLTAQGGANLPEPASMALLGVAFGALAFVRRRQRV